MGFTGEGVVEWWMVGGGEERDFVDGVVLKVDFFERLEFGTC